MDVRWQNKSQTEGRKKPKSIFVLAPMHPVELKFIVGENTVADPLTVRLWDVMYSVPALGGEAC
jgi:hypothetical protein